MCIALDRGVGLQEEVPVPGFRVDDGAILRVRGAAGVFFLGWLFKSDLQARRIPCFRADSKRFAAYGIAFLNYRFETGKISS